MRVPFLAFLACATPKTLVSNKTAKNELLQFQNYDNYTGGVVHKESTSLEHAIPRSRIKCKNSHKDMHNLF